jgi:hypothetical protein
MQEAAMAEQHPDQTPGQTGSGLKRRGLLAAAWAAAAAFVVKQTTEPVAAITDTNFVATGTSTNFDARGNAHVGVATDSGTFETGVAGFGSLNGVFGFAQKNIGVLGNGPTGVLGQGQNVGVAAAGGSYGVLVPASAGGPSVGVLAQGNSYGVVASSLTGTGVLANGPQLALLAAIPVSSTASQAAGVWGLNESKGGFGYGVLGTIDGTDAVHTVGVFGQNLSTDTGGGVPGNGGWGVYGFSKNGHGVVGATTSPGSSGIVGNALGVPGVWAGVFFGPIAVVGGAKSAAVANGDGTHSLLYCMESPESWFEDFGEAALECGHAEVVIDPAFAAVADMSNYHVFLTERGDFQLHVASQRPDRFIVQQTTGVGQAASDGTFSWRLVAKRKDIAAPRLAKVQLPPQPTHVDPPRPPKPELPRASGNSAE